MAVFKGTVPKGAVVLTEEEAASRQIALIKDWQPVEEVQVFYNSERLVLNPVLNFISRARNAGCSADSIVKIACDFYKGEMLIKAKKILWADASITRVTERLKMTDIVSDMVRAFDLCDEKKTTLPLYLIFKPEQIPCVPGHTWLR
ncbi:hypothetical protein QYM36_004956 [Artemia franciscana]|uniref:Uncharacterized protein n=1 Tax=Artemia franciscana TaxID=6661 RepID=A0AA88LAQ0_ARTSF|nr:hypothetical protein QYM36_004956 [Artemia franciscana]